MPASEQPLCGTPSELARWSTGPVRREGRREQRYAFVRGLDFPSIVAVSERVDWTVDGVFRERCFDACARIVSASWLGSGHLEFLDHQAQLTLNHCRAFSYVHLLGNFEEFIPPHLAEIVRQAPHCDGAHLRALCRFGAEEMKHQQLFRRAEMVLEQSCGHPFGRYFDDDGRRVTELANAILEYPPLPRSLILLALEWGTQRNYVESSRQCTTDRDASLYADILRAHWVEEAQHTKSGTLEIAHLARDMSPEELGGAFDQVADIGRLVDATLVGQVDEEITTVQCCTGRRFSCAETARLRESLHQSLSAIIVGVALTHPRFATVARELSPRGAARLGITAAG